MTLVSQCSMNTSIPPDSTQVIFNGFGLGQCEHTVRGAEVTGVIALRTVSLCECVFITNEYVPDRYLRTLVKLENNFEVDIWLLRKVFEYISWGRTGETTRNRGDIPGFVHFEQIQIHALGFIYIRAKTKAKAFF